MFIIVWKYKIKPDNRVLFESEYGKKGAWSRFFKRSKDYSGSELYNSQEGNDIYLLMDSWFDKKSYDNFINEQKNGYERLSLKFENLYETEEKLGTITE